MRLLSMLASLLLVLGVSAAALAQDIIISGALVASGPYGAYGTDARAGIDLKVEELNAAGGVLGRKIRVIYDDTGGDRAKAVALYRQYGDRPDTVFAFSIASSEFVALNPVTNQVGLPLISIGSSIPFKDFSPWSFRVNLILDKAMASVMQQLKEIKRVKTIAVIHDTVNNFTVAEMETVKANAGGAGLQVLGVESFNTGEQNFTLQLTRLASLNPDVLWVSATTDEAALIISQARALGIKAPIIGGAGLNDPRIGALPGGAALGVMTFALFNPADPRPATAAFVRRYGDKNNGQTPAAYVALGYDAMGLVADAIRRANSVARDAVRKALGETQNYEGANGPFRYQGSGDNLAQSPRLLVFTDKGFVPLTP
jgi:branched-chain amino acid transport system substrate-binding protein